MRHDARVRLALASLPLRRLLALAPALAALSGCGFNVQSADLFLLQRHGPQGHLSLLVSDGGTISCNGGRIHPIPDSLLIQARDLADDLDADARHHLDLPTGPKTVNTFIVKLQNGTVRFPDTAAVQHNVLARTELFAVQAAQQACGLSG